ncbi:ABC transporter permease [Leucothrix sargassi]|nr:ABC transporter permease [Leucothrix sargassi]
MIRALITTIGLLVAWQLIVTALAPPRYIFPGPWDVMVSFVENAELLFENFLVTGTEILVGLLIGCTLGILSALLLISFEGARRWLLPVLVISQAIPVFALAPLLTLWFGYGMAPKIIMASLIIFFPVSAACHDGLRHAPTARLDLARTMGASQWAILRHIRLPSALPAIASGVRVATAVAPIGAIVGEWVGSSEGLGYIMLHANARMQTDLMFAALFLLCLASVALYFSVNRLLDHFINWQVDTTGHQQSSLT